VENGKSTVKWIIGMCIAIALAVMGWTVTGTLAMRMRAIEEIKNAQVSTQINVAANNIRISVLENKYDMIQVSLAEIKALLMEYTRAGK
jgi:uncharacterized protein YqgV (UPF0045/DUF77 family)